LNSTAKTELTVTNAITAAHNIFKELLKMTKDKNCEDYVNQLKNTASYTAFKTEVCKNKNQVQIQPRVARVNEI